MTPHEWIRIKGIPWLVCRECGLIWVKNAFTAWCVRHGCECEQHPDYRRQWEKAGPTSNP